MKIFRETNYRVQSTNQHLKNILEENYYIELGYISLKTLSKLFTGAVLDMEEFIYNDIATEGIGQILESKESSLDYQFAYLFHLRQKISTHKIFLTYNAIRYENRDGLEIYAPVILIPVDIDNINKKLVMSSEPIPNKLFINELAVMKEIDLAMPETFNNLASMDAFCRDLVRKTKTKLSADNYLTYAKVEYPDYNVDHHFFDIERSIYETTARDIQKEFFMNIKAVRPTNIYQKYVLLKANNGENFAVDGKLGSGKTYTALNIVADKVAKGKRVLYVCQDNDSINAFQRMLWQYQMGRVSYNFARIQKENYQTEILLPQSSNDSYSQDVIKNIEEYEDSMFEKVHGFPYKTMTDAIAIIKNTVPDIKEMVIEPTLEHFEVKQVQIALKEIAILLKDIDPLVENLWTPIEEYYNSNSIPDIIKTVTEYEKVQKDFNTFFKTFCTTYNIQMPKSFNDSHRIVSHIRSFNLTKVPNCWANDKLFQEAKVALENLNIAEENHYVLNKNYEIIVSDDYQKGDAEDILDLILYKHLNTQDVKYINQLLLDYAPIDEVITNLRNCRKNLTRLNGELCKLLGLEKLPTNIYPFMIKLEHLFAHSDVSPKWLRAYAVDPEKWHKLNPRMGEIINKANDLYANIIPYMLKPELFKYETLKLISGNRRFEHMVATNYDRKKMRSAKKSSDSLYRDILSYMDEMSELVMFAQENNLADDIKPEDFANGYRNWIDFCSSLNNKEDHIFIALINNNDVNYLFQNDYFLKKVSDFNEQCAKANEGIEHLTIYGIKVNGAGTIEQMDNVDEWLQYLKRVIRAKQQLKKTFKNNVNMTFKDLIQVVNMDRDYVNLFQVNEENYERYAELLGETYSGLDTDCNSISLLMDHFEAFKVKMTSAKGIATLIKSGQFTSMINEYIELDSLSEKVMACHRQFSRFFQGGLPHLLECTLDESLQEIKKYNKKKEQVEAVFKILENLRYFEKLGLRSLASGIKDSTYKEHIADQYLYSTYTIYRNEVLKRHPLLNEQFLVLEVLDNYNNFERNYCNNNLIELANTTGGLERRNRDRQTSIQFNDYNRIVLQEERKRIFLANLDIFNSQLDLQQFDTIILDDCQISSANKYNRLGEAKQVIVFGNNAFRSSIANCLLKRINNSSIIRYKKRYYKLGSKFNNNWSINDNYIYDFEQKVDIMPIDNIQKMAISIVHYYYQNTARVINVIVSSDETRRQIYTELAKKLSDNYTSSEVIGILRTNIRIINTTSEDASFVSDVFFYFDDFKNQEINNLELVFRNFTAVSDRVVIMYVETRDEEDMQKIRSQIQNLIGEHDEGARESSGIVKIMLDKMRKRGIKAISGFGRFDIIIKNKDGNHFGVMIEGNDSSMPYSLLDDYQYYYNEYTRCGWSVFIFFVEDLIDNLDRRIDEIAVQLGANKRSSKVTQMTIDEIMTDKVGNNNEK